MSLNLYFKQTNALLDERHSTSNVTSKLSSRTCNGGRAISSFSRSGPFNYSTRQKLSLFIGIRVRLRAYLTIQVKKFKVTFLSVAISEIAKLGKSSLSSLMKFRLNAYVK